MGTIKERRLALLEDTVKYYSEDMKRRCTKKKPNCDAYNCYYSPITANKVGISDGCAIGRLLSDELKLKLDEFNLMTVDDVKIMRLLPPELKELGKEFLRELQILHDGNGNKNFWYYKGLTKAGKSQVELIKSRYELN